MKVELIAVPRPTRWGPPPEEITIPYLPEDAYCLHHEARWFSEDFHAKVHLEVDGQPTPLPWTPSPHP